MELRGDSTSRTRRAALVLMVAVVTGSIGPARAQPEPERTAVSPNFSVTWVDSASSPDAPDLADADASGVPDTVERLLAAFEEARAFLVDELGYVAPPVEGRYPLYVAAGTGRGYTQPLHEGDDRSKPSFILVPARIARTETSDDAMRAFAVHEFHHAIQIGYDAGENHWVTEATSVWLEELWLDALDRNHFWLRSFVPLPERGLGFIGAQHEYGAFVFLEFLVERYGGGSRDLVRELWELMAVPDAIPGAPDLDSFHAIAELLRRHGVSLEHAWAEFSLWRWDVRHFTEGDAYRRALDGAGWPAVTAAASVAGESCRLATESSLPLLASEYVALTPAPAAPLYGQAVLTVRGEPGTTAAMRLKLRRLPVDERVLSFDEEGAATVAIPFGRRQARRVVVALGNASIDHGAQVISYSLRYPGLDDVEAGPVQAPLGIDYFSGVTLTGTVTCASAPAPFAQVRVTQREVVSGAEQVFEVETDASGRWFLPLRPEANASYRAEVVDPLLSPAEARAAFVGVHVEVLIEPEGEALPAGEPVTLTGEVVPAHGGALVTIEFRRPERPWRTGPQTVTDAGGGYSVEIALPRGGVWELRAQAETRDDDHFDGTSFMRTVRIGRE